MAAEKYSERKEWGREEHYVEQLMGSKTTFYRQDGR